MLPSEKSFFFFSYLFQLQGCMLAKEKVEKFEEVAFPIMKRNVIHYYEENVIK